MSVKFKIKKGDLVQVLSGSCKGSKGKVLHVYISKSRVLVEGVGLVKKRTKPTSQKPQGGIEEKEASIHISNVSLVDSSGVSTRVGYRFNNESGKKERFSKKTKEVI